MGYAVGDVMKVITLSLFAGILCGCKKNEPQKAPQRVHAIELSEPLEIVQVTLAGRDDLKLNVFQRDGRLVAAIVDQRTTVDDRNEEIQRWEMLAKSNREVALIVRKDLYWLKHVEGVDVEYQEAARSSKGTVLHSDTNGDGVLDYLYSANGRYKVSGIVYENFETLVTSFDVHELPPVTPDQVFPFSPGPREAQQDGIGQPAIRAESKSEGGEEPQPEAEGRSR
jgi:hypothetical protein